MSDIHASVGSYVTHALSSGELDEFEDHLAGCDNCRQDVAEFNEAVAELSSSIAATPPPEIRTSVLHAIKDVRPLPAEVDETEHQARTEAKPQRVETETSSHRVAAGAEAATRRPDPEASNPPTAAHQTHDGPVDDLAIRRQRRANRLLTLAVAATTVIALALGGWVYTLNQDRQAQVSSAQLESRVLSAPDATVRTGVLENGARVSFVVSRSENKALFVADDLPPAGEGKKYQLWTIHGTQATADNLLDGGPVAKRWFAGDIENVSALGVTIEPESGSQTPTEPVLSVPI